MNWPLLLRFLGFVAVGFIIGTTVRHARGLPVAVPICPAPAPLEPSTITGTVEATLGTGDRAIVIRAEGDGFTVLVRPGSGEKWLMLPVRKGVE